VPRTLVPPIKLEPLLEPKPWGGRRLEQWGIALPPDEPIGEALLTAPEAIVSGGPLAGHSLGALCQRAPAAWIGPRGHAATGGRAQFPLLCKLLDARTNLSIQIHPNDAQAAAAGLGVGKTEAYYILDAEPGSVLYLGLRPDADVAEFAAACRSANGSGAGFLRQIPVESGMTFLIPAGTLHAPGAGVMFYEIQQPSAITFRLDDWGRTDAAGRRRALHQAEGLAVLDPSSRPQPLAAVRLDPDDPRRELLAATRYFALERITLAADDSLPLTGILSPQVLTAIDGMGDVESEAGRISMRQGETVVVPVESRSTLSVVEATVVLRGWIPDLDSEVLNPARAAGIAIADLLGPGSGC
jgi:mannose-6-phosphate isomerase